MTNKKVNDLASATVYWTNCSVAYVFCSLSCFSVCAGLVCFVHLWPMSHDFNLRTVLITGLLISLTVTAVIHRQIRLSCGVAVSACLAAQLTGLIIHFFANWTTFDNLWPLTVFSFVLACELSIMKFKFWPRNDFGLFKTRLSAGAAVIGSLAQTMIGLDQLMTNNNCVVLTFALISTCFIALNIKVFADQLPTVGPTIFHNYLIIAKQIVHGKINKRSLTMRICLFLVALVGFNPCIAFAASS